MGIFYKPKDGVCADFIPYYNPRSGTFELYYLHDYRDMARMGEGCPWYRLTTTDFVHFGEDGEILPRGGREEQDLFVYTGCVVEKDDLYHIFYTGHNHYLIEKGGRGEAVMHAVSTDGVHWTKKPEDTFFAPEEAPIEKNDWRDPFVFFNEEEGRYWMLLCTRKLEGPSRRRGATGLLVSDDLKDWTYTGSLWDPTICWCPECPDIFQWEGTWYLLYSTYCETEGMRTFYRMADSPRGPWRNPGDNVLESRAFYAGKTASDGKNRYIFGWNPTKEGEADKGTVQWGGHLVVHKLIRYADGRLGTAVPEQLEACYTQSIPLDLRPGIGCKSPEIDAQSCTAGSASGFAAVTAGEIPRQCQITFDIRMKSGTDAAGVMLHATDGLEKGYYLRLERGGRMVFDSTDRWCEHPEMSRRIGCTDDTVHHVRILLDDTVFLAYLDNEIALSARMYDINGSGLAFFALDGEASFSDIRVSPYQNAEDIIQSAELQEEATVWQAVKPREAV